MKTRRRNETLMLATWATLVIAMAIVGVRYWFM
jgi:hypothetical protein